MPFDGLKSEVKAILELRLDTESARAEHDDAIFDVIRRLEAEIETVTQRANGYPANPNAV